MMNDRIKMGKNLQFGNTCIFNQHNMFDLRILILESILYLI